MYDLELLRLCPSAVKHDTRTRAAIMSESVDGQQPLHQEGLWKLVGSSRTGI